MPHCTRCGTELSASAQFCPTCGQPQPVTPGQAAPSWQPAPVATGSGMSETTAATLSYLLGWLTGIIFFLIDKRPYVRFHAAQSIVTFGGLHIIRAVLGLMFGVGWAFGGFGHWGYAGWGSLGLGIMLLIVLSLLSLVLWIVCMIKAATGSWFELPIAGPIAQSLAGQ